MKKKINMGLTNETDAEKINHQILQKFIPSGSAEVDTEVAQIITWP